MEKLNSLFTQKYSVIAISSLIVVTALSFSLLGPKDFFLMSTGVTILILVLMKPFYGLSLLAFSIPFAGILQVGPQLTANKIFALWVLISFILGSLVKNERINVLSSTTMNSYLLFHVLILAVLAFGFVFSESLQGLFSQFFLLGLVVLVAVIPQNFQQFKVVCLATAAGSCLLGLYTAFFGMGSLVGRYGTRLAAGTNENVLAHALGIGLIFSFFALQESTKRLKFLIIIMDFFTLYAIFLTGSRGTWMALILGVVLFPVFAQKIPLRKRMIYVFMGSLVIFILFIGLRNNYYGQFGQLISTRLSEHDSISRAAGGRLDSIWPYYINKFYEKPLFGWGKGFSNDVGMAAHNDFLNIIVETGIIGFILFLNFLIFALKDILRNKDATLRLQSLILFVYLLVAGLTHNTLSLKSYALGIGALCFLAKMSNKEEKNDLLTKPGGA